MSPAHGWGAKGKAETTRRPRLPGPDDRTDQRLTGQERGKNTLQTRTDLELPLDPPFAALTEVHLGLVVLGHHLHKLPGQDRVLRGQGQGREPPGGKGGTGSEPQPQPRPRQLQSRDCTAKGSSWWEGRLVQHWETVWRLLKKPRNRAAISPSKSTPGCIHLYLHKLIQNDTRTPVITRAKLFTTAGSWNPPGCPPTKDWIKKM